MPQKKDKQKVLGEIFDDERVRSFLNVESHGDVNADFNILERAYRGMQAENFETFVQFFKEAGHNLNAKNPRGETLLKIVSDHRQSNEYKQALTAAGATL